MRSKWGPPGQRLRGKAAVGKTAVAFRLVEGQVTASERWNVSSGASGGCLVVYCLEIVTVNRTGSPLDKSAFTIILTRITTQVIKSRFCFLFFPFSFAVRTINQLSVYISVHNSACFVMSLYSLPRHAPREPFHPRVTAVARKRSRSFCQKCGLQVTAKYACTLRMWLCMK